MTVRDLLFILSGLFLILGILVVMYLRRLRGEQSLQKRVASSTFGSSEFIQVAQTFSESQNTWIERFFHNNLIRAGLEMTTSMWSTVVGLSALLGSLGFFLISNEPVFSLVGMAMGLFIPFGVLLILAARRRRLIQSQLPDALFLIARALRTGVGIERSMVHCAEQAARPMADEFRRTLRQVSLGLPIATAIDGMADRLALEDLDIFVATIRLNQLTGGSLAPMIDRVAKGARERNEFRVQVQTATALSRTTAGFIAMAHPVLIVTMFWLQPEIMSEFVKSSIGWSALMLSIGLEVIGVLWLLAILRIRL